MSKPKALDEIDHIAISVKDVGKAVAWYTKTFKCEVEYQDETWAFLKFGNIKLAFVMPGQHPRHIAFAVDDAGRFGEVEKHRDGTISTYVKDPAGNSVEMVEKSSIKNYQVKKL
jgi:catechol 2,3-dioxygenase-like lactoylglutathione lyase family enzyme